MNETKLMVMAYVWASSARLCFFSLFCLLIAVAATEVNMHKRNRVRQINSTADDFLPSVGMKTNKASELAPSPDVIHSKKSLSSRLFMTCSNG
ncbi:hypothetical protein [Atopomonas hussainii]|uniref:hypothetical protein n=1 Tax=Atopomonas hussainii TaxID=1429083 RepID=UPI001113B2B2|nr:hypothetical protein [Atopomonas hussainii]